MTGLSHEHRPRRVGRTSRQATLQEAVLDAALSLFATRGYDGVSIAEIAERAAISKASVLYHFHSKEDLWKSAVDRCYQRVDAFFAENMAAAASDGVERLRWSLHVFMRACHQFPDYIRLQALEGATASWRAKWLGERHVLRHIEAGGRSIRDLQDAGAIPPMDPLIVQSLLAAGGQLLVSHAAMLEAATGRDLTQPDFADAFVDAVVGLLASASERRN